MTHTKLLEHMMNTLADLKIKTFQLERRMNEQEMRQYVKPRSKQSVRRSQREGI